MIEIIKKKSMTGKPNCLCNACTEEQLFVNQILIQNQKGQNTLLSIRLCDKCLKELKEKLDNLELK